jgi:D-alanyl-D-alanine-carboxypeptidase/D-alanyl-D-alanine-endopeptidase
LRSTVRDQLRFLRANLKPESTPLTQAIQASQQERFKGEGGQIAQGWLFTNDGKDLFHNGQTGGYHSFAQFRKGGDIAVVVLSNSAHVAVDVLGIKLFDLLVEESTTVQTP